MKTFAVITIVTLGVGFVALEAYAKPDCNIACNKIADPVCAEDKCHNQVTFSNPCMLCGANCRNPRNTYQVIYRGECRPPRQPTSSGCDFACTADVNPVCGGDRCGNRKTFSNECVLRLNNCNDLQHPYALIANGECCNEK